MSSFQVALIATCFAAGGVGCIRAVEGDAADGAACAQCDVDASAPPDSDASVSSDAGTGLDAGGVDGASTCLNIPESTDVLLRAGNPFTAAPRLSWTGTRFGAVWTEVPTNGSGQIHFAFLDPSSLVLEDERVISDTAHDCAAPSLRYSGSGFGVAYSDKTARTVTFLPLDASGSPGGAPVQVGTIAGSGLPVPEIAFNSTQAEWGVAWLDSGLSSEMYFARVLPDGTASAATRVASHSGAAIGACEVQWNGMQFELAYSEGDYGCYLADIDASGGIIARHPLASTVGCSSPTLAPGPGEYLIAFSAFPFGSAPELVYSARADADRNFIAGSERLLSPTSNFGMSPRSNWNGAEWAIAWESAPSIPKETSDIWLSRISPSGDVTFSDKVVCSPDADAQPYVSWDGARHFITYQRCRWSEGYCEARLLVLP